MGEEHAGVDEGAVGEAGDQPSERAGAVPLEELAEDAAGRAAVRAAEAVPAAAVRRPRSSISARVRDRVCASSQREVGGARCARRRAARPRGRAPGAQRAEPASAPARRRPVGARQPRRPRHAVEEQHVERRVEVHRQPPPRPQVADRDRRRPPRASAAARCRTPGPAAPGARSPAHAMATMSADARWFASASALSPAAARTNASRSAASPAGSSRSRARRGPRPGARRTRRRSRAPNGVASGGSRRRRRARHRRPGTRRGGAPPARFRGVEDPRSSGPASAARSGAGSGP